MNKNTRSKLQISEILLSYLDFILLIGILSLALLLIYPNTGDFFKNLMNLSFFIYLIWGFRHLITIFARSLWESSDEEVKDYIENPSQEIEKAEIGRFLVNLPISSLLLLFLNLLHMLLR